MKSLPSWSAPFLVRAISAAAMLGGFSGTLQSAQTASRVSSSGAAKVTPAEDPMLKRVFPSIVRIEVIRLRPSDGRLTKQWTAGSGVIISNEGHVVTNCHVTEDGDYFRCYLFDGAHIDATRLGQDAL